MGAGSEMQGDPEGPVHHICTNKNEISEATGGPWTPIFEPYFERAGMSLDDPANLVRIRGHQGPHPREYHEAVLSRIDKAMGRCRSEAQCRVALVSELMKIAKELTMPGAMMRKLVTKNAGK